MTQSKIPQADLLNISLLLVSVKDTPVTSLKQGRVRSLLECAHACLLRGEWREAHEAIAKAKTHETGGTLSRRFLAAFRELRAKHEPRPAPIVAAPPKTATREDWRLLTARERRRLTTRERRRLTYLREKGGWSWREMARAVDAPEHKILNAAKGLRPLDPALIAALVALRSRVEPALSPRPAASFDCRYLTPEEQAHGLALRAGGWSFIRLAEALEASPGTLHGAVHGKTRLHEDIIAALLRLEVNS